MDQANRAESPARARPPFDCIALVLQGGGALGAYQAGVYQALAEADLHPDWIAGISIGAINAALIAGNPPESRIERLKQFWQRVTSPPGLGTGLSGPPGMQGFTRATEMGEQFLRKLTAPFVNDSSLAAAQPWTSLFGTAGGLWDFADMVKGDTARSVVNQFNAHLALTQGATGFFAPRVPSPWYWPNGSFEATSYYDTKPLRATLEEFVDFDLINRGKTRFSVGAVNVRTGNFVYFDTTTHTIRPEHVMASGALPPGFPPVEIEGEAYWDGGLVSNTPLQWLVECQPHQDMLAFQVDLWSARGDFPSNMAEVATRMKEIQFSSRTRANSDRVKQISEAKNAIASLLKKLPQELRDSPEVKILSPLAERKQFNLVQLIYRSKRYEGDSKDYEFSARSMDDHWMSGYHDTVRTLRHREVLEPADNLEGIATFDLGEQD